MSIKNLKPSNNSGFIQGYFTPKHPDKYIGPTPIIYRSSWERKFMIMCDSREDVIKWSSERLRLGMCIHLIKRSIHIIQTSI